MAIVGLQFVIWSLTGLYMVSFDIHFIHGESMQKQTDKLNIAAIKFSFDDLLKAYPKASNIQLGTLLDAPVFRFTDINGQQQVVSAIDGQILSPLDNAVAKQVACNHFLGRSCGAETNISSVRLITEIADKPDELSARRLPAWQINFEFWFGPTFYVSQYSGQVVTTRHHFWRLFDWMWRFHIMDYDDGQNSRNNFLFTVALTSLLATMLGLCLSLIHI